MIQIITWAAIWAAVVAQGYRPQPMSCYVDASGNPEVCMMPLGQTPFAGFLMISTDGGIVTIDEQSYSTRDGG